MGAFMQWYLRNLRTRPMLTNLCSGVILMTTGDIMAQSLERHHAGDKLTGSSPTEGVPVERRLSLRRYGTHGGPIEEDGTRSASDWHVAGQIALNGLKHEVENLDVFRMGTMAAWACVWTTPVMLYFYRFLDLLFPQRTPYTVIARVLLSVVFSIPNNAMFFAYGTSVHHTAEWVAVREEWRQELHDFGLDEKDIDDIMNNGPPFDWEMMLAKAVLKIQLELVETVSTSAKIWIPFNLINFSVIPTHLRPLGLMVFSVFWNCYLSLIQHRDLPLPEEATSETQ